LDQPETVVGSASAATLPTGWRSYDSVAATYARVAVPWFAELAFDLVSAVSPTPGDSVLDVGTGTGLVAGLANEAVRPRGRVVGADPSCGMLSQSGAGAIRVAAMAPGLPFGEGCFDLVLANLVLSHLPDLGAGLEDMARVTRPGGRFGASAWAEVVAAGAGNDQPLADRLVVEMRTSCGLAAPPQAVTAVPFENELRSRERLADALASAGLADLSVELRRYQHEVAVDDYLSGWGSSGRCLRHTYGQERWDEFTERAAATLKGHFGESLSCVLEAWIATGRRPACSG
jgi:SAM-dependent methyltransferase